MDITYTLLDSPIGLLRVATGPHGLVAIHFRADETPAPAHWREGGAGAAETQLRAYFDGRLRRFDLSLDPAGTPFQQQVWAALSEIPYGETISYGELARRVGRPEAVRAVGVANGRNPLPVVIPCHRVVGSDGTLTGYAGGLAVKRALLRLEGIRLPEPEPQLSLF